MSLSPRDPLVVGRVVGDVVDPFMRLISLDVTYGQREITNGMDLRSSQVLNKPTVEIGGDDLRNFYNFGYGGSRCAKSKQPVPPRIPPLAMSWCTTRIHVPLQEFTDRVALILFRQLGRQTVYAPQWRQRFNTREFAENYNLGLPWLLFTSTVRERMAAEEEGPRRYICFHLK